MSKIIINRTISTKIIKYMEDSILKQHGIVAQIKPKTH